MIANPKFLANFANDYALCMSKCVRICALNVSFKVKYRD